MINLLLPFYIATASPPPPPPVYTWCVFQMIQTNTKEMISTAYGMGNVPSATNLTDLCQSFYTRDIRAEDKPLELVSSRGESTITNPDNYWIANTWRSKLIPQELQDYAGLFKTDSDVGNFLTTTTTAAINLMPASPDSMRIPALMISAIESVNSPILRYAAVVFYTPGLPLMSIAALVKAGKLTKR